MQNPQIKKSGLGLGQKGIEILFFMSEFFLLPDENTLENRLI